MALRAAIANGNWSNPAIWNNGVLPGANDIVASNGFTVTIDQNVTVGRLTNVLTAPQILSAPMTGYTTPSGIVTASSFLYDAYLPWFAFNQGYGEWLSSTASQLQWLAYEFTSLKVVRSYQISPAQNNAPASIVKDWTFEGWNGTNWVVLDTVTGNSITTTITRTLSNTTAYIKYRINSTAIIGSSGYTGISELLMYEADDYMVNSVAGGGFILANNINLTCTIELLSGNTTLVLWSGGAGVTNTITSPRLTGAGSGRTIDVNGTGTLNLNITTITGIASVTPTLVYVGAAATLNILGTFQTFPALGGTMLHIAAAATINLTGDIRQTTYTNSTYYVVLISAVGSTFNITGDVLLGVSAAYWGTTFRFNAVYRIVITGTVKAVLGSLSDTPGLTPTNGYLSIVGPIISEGNAVAVESTNGSGINLFTGPFISNSYGFVPIKMVRMHLIPTNTSYYEFRDETTGGALAPVPPAPPTQLMSPATLVSNLAIADVRFGTVYAMGTLTGTLRMPSANQVTFGVAVDDTFGNSVLTAASVWDYLVANITVENSIGMRLKNVSTPQTTGEQLEAFLRLE
jgi:hypothetical protein